MADLSFQQGAEPVCIVNETSGNELVVNSDGSILVSQVDGTKATYSACAVGFTAATLATDIFMITGSATKTVRITRIEFTITTTAGAGIAANVSLIKRSAANTAGTFVSDTAVPMDSNNAAATAVVGHYTANPTALGAAVGTIRADRYAAQTAGTPAVPLVWDFGTRPGQAIVLNNANERIVLNLGAVTITGAVASINVEWTEA